MSVRLEADWLSDPLTVKVMDALDARQEGASRFVGGCVRNTLMGRAVDDIDIATKLRPDETMAALEAHGIRAIGTGLDHGTVTGVLDGRPFEITTLRRDVETDGRRAVVAFSEDWSEDAQRRDFRLNALYADRDGEVYDPVGGGLDDARVGRVIFIGDADQRLREDYLRILRFFRFNAWYGAGIDADGLAACARHREALSQIARERIWKEFSRLLAAPDPSGTLAAMDAAGVLQIVLGGAWGGTQRTGRLVSLERELDLDADPILRLMTLVPGQPEHVVKLSERLRLSNAERDRLLAWADPDLPALAEAVPRDLRAALYGFGVQAVRDRALVEQARSGAPVSQAFLQACADWTRPELPVGGADALACGLSGPAVGAALQRAEAAWIESDFSLSRTQLLGLLSQTA